MTRAASIGGRGIALVAFGLFASAEAGAAEPPAGAACLSDATRAAAARERAPEDQRGRISDLVAAAERAARDKDGTGCRSAADDALRAAGLTPLAPILHSTSMTGERRGARRLFRPRRCRDRRQAACPGMRPPLPRPLHPSRLHLSLFRPSPARPKRRPGRSGWQRSPCPPPRRQPQRLG
ncbi:hypothetical protein [Muricoccus vinaceus]|uniref:Uncharacterized protein n=1 Tax=Muricoccus vinaceus TaxID=424704 RepID=A0ABV6ILH8_9PROT